MSALRLDEFEQSLIGSIRPCPTIDVGRDGVVRLPVLLANAEARRRVLRYRRRQRQEATLTRQMAGALQHLASRGELTIRREARIVYDEVATRTAWALERRGLAERRWTGAEDGVLYITAAGRALADTMDGIDPDEDE